MMTKSHHLQLLYAGVYDERVVLHSSQLHLRESTMVNIVKPARWRAYFSVTLARFVLLAFLQKSRRILPVRDEIRR